MNIFSGYEAVQKYMEFEFYGVRGSCPTPMSQSEYKTKVENIILHTLEVCKNNLDPAVIYSELPIHLRENVGGNTTCLYIRSRTGTHCIFDMGTGIRELGNRLAREAFSDRGLDLSIFMTHTHWDHIQGWPFFKPAYSPRCKIDFYSCIPNLEERLDRQQWNENFPLGLSLMGSQKSFYLLKEWEEISIGDLHITPFYLKHPGSCTGYKIREGNDTVVFATDVEFRPEDWDAIRSWGSELGEVGVLIIDAQYSAEEADQKIGWGHTSVKMAVEVATQIRAKRVYLTHFEPDHSDESIYRILQEEVGGMDLELTVIPAREGLKFDPSQISFRGVD